MDGPTKSNNGSSDQGQLYPTNFFFFLLVIFSQGSPFVGFFFFGGTQGLLVGGEIKQTSSFPGEKKKRKWTISLGPCPCSMPEF